jgi:hypothetical protein
LRQLLFVSEDAGAARALAPVAALRRRSGDRVRWLAAPIAADAIGATDARVVTSLADLEGALAAELAEADAVVTGSSCWGLRLEARAVRAARGRRPTATLIDFPSQLQPRLSFPGDTDLGALPDRVLALDATMRDALVTSGVEARRIVVTGSPALDECWGAPLARRPRLDAVLFLSQPLESLYGADASAPGWLGYSERTVLRELAPLVRDLGLELLVRPHPREDAAALAAALAALPGPPRLVAGPLREALEHSACAVGMTTMALVEAALCGVPSVSAQLGRRGADPLPSNASGLTIAVDDAASLAAALAEAVRHPDGVERLERARALGWSPGAAERVSAAVDALLAERTP